jgi:glycosyltransferase involved in cell wall biosynthesis
MEALASGLPVIATSISGVPELVRHSETGYLVSPGDAGELARILEQVYLHPDQAAYLAKNGYELVLKEFNLYNNVEKLSALLIQSLNLQPASVNSTLNNSMVETMID